MSKAKKDVTLDVSISQGLKELYKKKYALHLTYKN